MRQIAAILWLVLAVPAWGQDAAPVPLIIEGEYDIVKVRRFIPVDEDRQALKKIPFTIKIPVEQARGAEWTVPTGVTFVKTSARSIQVTAAPKGELTVSVFWEVADWDAKKFINGKGILTFLVGDVPIPPVPPEPKPPTPDPKPPLPPQPVLSFRVVFVAESGKTLTAQQNSVIAGKVVRDWLTANTTPEGKYAGWRHYDPQQTVANESLGMKSLWEAVQPKLSALPCVVVEVNGHAEIIPLAATPAEMLKIFEKYKGGL